MRKPDSPESLFDPNDVGRRARAPRKQARRLHSVEQPKLNRGGATLLLSDIDALLIRSVKPHSAGKARLDG